MGSGGRNWVERNENANNILSICLSFSLYRME
jgi:hypothetical protein